METESDAFVYIQFLKSCVKIWTCDQTNVKRALYHFDTQATVLCTAPLRKYPASSCIHKKHPYADLEYANHPPAHISPSSTVSYLQFTVLFPTLFIYRAYCANNGVEGKSDLGKMEGLLVIQFSRRTGLPHFVEVLLRDFPFPNASIVHQTRLF